jgi:general secretion pathway protein G
MVKPMSSLMRGRGFTLIELLVVLAIVAVLLTLTVPRYYGKVDQAKEAVLRENLRTTRDVLGKFYADVGRYPQSLEELVDKKYLSTTPIDPITESAEGWTLVSPPSGYSGNVYDLRSASSGTGSNGVPYAQW